MDDPRSARTADRRHVRIAGEQEVGQRADRPPGARMHRHTGRLVEHDEIVVGVEHRQRPGLCDQSLVVGLARGATDDPFIAGELVRALRLVAVDGDEPVSYPRLDPTAGGLESAGEETVEPLARRFGRNVEADRPVLL